MKFQNYVFVTRRLTTPDSVRVKLAPCAICSMLENGTFFSRAGMQDKDVIIAINGKQVESTQDVFDALDKTEVEFTVRRGNSVIKIRVVPEEVV